MHAIHRGAPLFNSGHREECTKLYEATGHALLKMSKVLPRDSSAVIKMALQKASQQHCPTTRAWIMRRVFDKTLAQAK